MKKTTQILAVAALVLGVLVQNTTAGHSQSSRTDVRVSPEGSVYDARTHVYVPGKGVEVRALYEKMTDSQRVAVLQGEPDRTGKIWYDGNSTLNLGLPRWVTPHQLAQLHDRERELLRRQRNARSRGTRMPLAYASRVSSPNTPATHVAYYNPDRLATLILGATVKIICPDKMGSGVITEIQGRKYVLTANHVIKGQPLAYIRSLKDASSGISNRTGGWHDTLDIAAIPLPPAMQHLPAVPLLERPLPVGTPVFLAGYPGGDFKVTGGVVTGYSPNGARMLHSAHGPEGSSGGMLITPNGRLGGIHTAYFVPGSMLYPNKVATPSSVIVSLVRTFGR